MTRSASFNKIWGYEALQIADENNEKTQEFMRSGWEGGSDKKAPSASVQNYHMQKTDQALQEVERQGYLSWRSDVPYSKGARVFFHGSTFHALKDNQDVEPQGSRDNDVWYLIPVKVYPTRYESVDGLGTAATHAASDFDPSGSAGAVQKNLDSLSNSLSTIAKTGKITDATGDLPWSRISDKPTLGDASPLNTDKAEWDGVGDTKETVITAHQLYGLREHTVFRDNITTAGLSGGDITKPYFKSGGGTDVNLARTDDLSELSKKIEDTKITRDTVIVAGFKNGDKSYPYFRHADNAVIDLARLEYVDALNTNMDNAKITRDNVTIAGFVNGNKFDPYFRHSSGEVIALARLAYLEETKKELKDGKVDRDNITTAGYSDGNKSAPYFSGPAGTTFLQERATSGSTTTNGTITFPNVITMQYGSYDYPDVTTVGTFTIPFNEPWARIMCVLITVDSGQDVTAVTLNVTNSNFQVRIREWYNGTFGGTIRWLALGFK